MTHYQPFEKLTQKEIIPHIEDVHSINLIEVPFRVALGRTARKCIYCQDYKARTQTKRVENAERLFWKAAKMLDDYNAFFITLNLDERKELAYRLDRSFR